MTLSQAAQHNEGSCDLCTGWHDAEEVAFMNRRASQAAQEKPTTLPSCGCSHGAYFHHPVDGDRDYCEKCSCRAYLPAQWKPSSPRTEAGHCYDDDGWREKQLALNAGRGTWGGNDGTVRGVLEAWNLPLEGFLRSLCDWGYEIVERQAAAATPSLDPRRFGKAIRNTGADWNIGDIGRVLNEYDALSASSEPNKAAAAQVVLDAWTAEKLDEYDSMADYEEHMAALGDPEERDMYICEHEPQHMMHIHTDDGPTAPSESDGTDEERYDCDPECAVEGSATPNRGKGEPR